MEAYKIEFLTWDRKGKQVKRVRSVYNVASQDEAIEKAQADMVKEFGHKLHVNFVFAIANKEPSIKKADWKSSLPADVFDHLQAALGGKRQAHFEYHPEGDGLYLDEGAKYQIRTTAGNWNSLHMQSEFSLHAGGGAASHAIGKTVTPPVGTFVIETNYFCGKKFVTVHHWGIKALTK